MMTGSSVELSCEELVKVVTEYLEGSLSREERTLFETHLCYCRPCRVYVEQMERTVRLAGGLEAVSVPTEQRDRLLAAFRDWNRSPKDGKP
jgi:predicted anti-sigma-YlaC factor YlaD